jgi:psiF repeat
MRASLSLLAVVATAIMVCATPAAIAQTSSPNTQQDRMKSCNTQAGAQKLAGDARKNFMSSCLSGTSGSSTAGMSQQDKMKACNTQAGAQSMTGDARKQFMSNCLKGS